MKLVVCRSVSMRSAEPVIFPTLEHLETGWLFDTVDVASNAFGWRKLC